MWSVSHADYYITEYVHEHDTLPLPITKQGKPCISYTGFSYTERKRNRFIYWHCRNRKSCSGPVVTLDVVGPPTVTDSPAKTFSTLTRRMWMLWLLKVLGKSVRFCKTSKRKDQLYISLLVSVWRIICENFNPNGLILAEI